MITSIISGFQVFDVIYMMIGKTNPAYANTQTVVMLFYRQAFDYGYKGYAAAISILIFAVIMLVTVIQMIGQKKWLNYDKERRRRKLYISYFSLELRSRYFRLCG